MTLGSVSWMIDCLAWPKRKRKMPCLDPGAFSARMTMALIISSVLPDRDPPANMICVAGDASSSLASSCLAVSLNTLLRRRDAGSAGQIPSRKVFVHLQQPRFDHGYAGTSLGYLALVGLGFVLKL